MVDPIGVIEHRLAELGIDLPPPPRVRAGYELGVVAGSLLFLSGAVGTAIDDEGNEYLPVRGAVGDEVSLEEGAESARLAALNLLAQAKSVLGDLDRIIRIVKVSGYVYCAPGFRHAPAVVDGASRLFHDVFGPERGAHARISLYQAEMSIEAPVELDLVAEVDTVR
jgi:enamine deaminase RidA (YjgF/YER057c/UK114 family)